MKREHVVLVLLLAASLPGSGCGPGSGPDGVNLAAPGMSDRDPFLDLVLEDPHGRSLPLADLAGKIRVFDVWATWCLPCREIIPHLNDLQKRYRDRGVVIIGVAIDSEPAEVVEFQRKVPMRYLSGMFSPGIEAVLGQPNAVPTTYLIDRSGTLRRTFVGIVDAGTLDKTIAALLE